MIVVTAPTGKIGLQLVPQLIAAGEDARVIARAPEKLSAEWNGEVDVEAGSMDDPAVLNRALDGAETLFWLVPSPYNAPDVVEHYLRFTRPAAAAIKAQGVKWVVAISSLYRGVDRKAGPGFAVRAMDEAIANTDADYRALWSANHMENLLRQVGSIKQGVFALPVKPDLKMPIVAIRDVASVAAGLLLDTSWTGQGGVAAMGPEDLSHEDLAETISDVLGRPVRFEAVPEDVFIAQITGRGGSEAVAQWLFYMFAQGGDDPYGGPARTSATATPTSFRQWCQDVLKSAVKH